MGNWEIWDESILFDHYTMNYAKSDVPRGRNCFANNRTTGKINKIFYDLDYVIITGKQYIRAADNTLYKNYL